MEDFFTLKQDALAGNFGVKGVLPNAEESENRPPEPADKP
jgi:hypothetical protein